MSDARGFRDGDEFDRAEVADHELDLADDQDLRRHDWDDLHGVGREWPSPDQVRAEQAYIKARAAYDAAHGRWFRRDW
jgi:hypothetical protein